MTVFKGVFLHFWKYKYIILIFMAIFFGFAYAFGQESPSQSYESQQLQLTVVNSSDSEISNGLIEHLSSENQVEVVSSFDRESLEEEVFLNTINGAVIIPEDIEENFMNGDPAVEIISDQRSPDHIQLETTLNRYFMFFNAELQTSDNIDTEKVNQLLAESIDVEMHDSVNVEEQSNFDYMSYFISFAGYWIILFLLIIVGNVMSEFNNSVLKQRMNVSPIKTSTFMIQTILAQVLIAIFLVAFIFFGGVALRADSLEGLPLGKMLLALFLIAVFTLSMHYVIGALTTNKFIINGLATFIAIGMAFMSGIMIPLEIMGETAQNIAQFLPLYYFTQIYAEPDITWGEAALPILILVLFTAAFLIIGMIAENKKKISSQ